MLKTALEQVARVCGQDKMQQIVGSFRKSAPDDEQIPYTRIIEMVPARLADRTPVFSCAKTEATAWEDIARQIIAARWHGCPVAVPDEYCRTTLSGPKTQHDLT